MSMWTSRVLMRHIGEQAVVVAAKSAQPRSREYRATLALESPLRIHDGVVDGRLRIHNAGNLTWRAASRVGPVRVGVQLLDANQQVQAKDFVRIPLPDDIPPGGDCVVSFESRLPDGARPRYLKIDMVAEGATWFEAQGSTPLIEAIPPGTASVVR
jgi:hypothetical protein